MDGKKREDGVRSFLDSRGITLPEGDPDDDASAETVHGLGNRKNELFHQTLRADGVEVFEGSRRYLDAVAAAGLKVAVVSSSANTREVLEHHRPGQVRPGARRRSDHAAKKASRASLRPTRSFAPPNCSTCRPDQAAVFEDAIAGVAAGRAGHFGAVIGVDRVDQAEALRHNGADVVVTDLAELLDA